MVHHRRLSEKNMEEMLERIVEVATLDGVQKNAVRNVLNFWLG